MKLYNRDYTKLTKTERSIWLRLQKLETRRVGGLRVTRSRFRQYPRAARHFVHLFPNNYLDIVELKNIRKLKKLLKRFRVLFRSPRLTERGILQMIREDQAHFIIGSILKGNFNFGHHEAYLFPEFPLGNSHRADFLIVGRSSGGYEFVFVELEMPTRNITIGNGDFGKAFRNGQSQIADWSSWLDANFQTLTEMFHKLKRTDMELPDEFVRFDRSRMHFVVVAGRRGDFKEKTYRMRRTGRQVGGPLVLHYDNVLDSAEAIIGEETY